jgi:hypothetical protein
MVFRPSFSRIYWHHGRIIAPRSYSLTVKSRLNHLQLCSGHTEFCVNNATTFKSLSHLGNTSAGFSIFFSGTKIAPKKFAARHPSAR